jgi:branched-chain amino acid transport system permease protein
MDASALIDGITNGCGYALVGMGFNLLFRPTKVLNFAQGEIVMLGGIVGAVLVAAGAPWAVALVAVLGGGALFAVVEERVAIRPILRRSANASGWIITTLAVSLIAASAAQLIWDATPRTLAAPAPLSTDPFDVGGAQVSSYQLAIIAFALLVAFASRLADRSRPGRMVLAVAEDREASLLRGIDPGRVTVVSWAVGGALAAATGLLLAPLIAATVGTGAAYLVRGFMAAAIGGVGSNVGALIGGVLIGLVEAFCASALEPAAQDAATFGVLLLVLLIRPHGIFGRGEARRV